MIPKRWMKLGILLIIVGVVLHIVNGIVYGPKLIALYNALKAWSSDHNAAAPNPASYGLDNTAFIMAGALSLLGYTLILIGAIYLAIYLIAKIAKRLGYVKETVPVVV